MPRREGERRRGVGSSVCVDSANQHFLGGKHDNKHATHRPRSARGGNQEVVAGEEKGICGGKKIGSLTDGKRQTDKRKDLHSSRKWGTDRTRIT